MPRNHCTCFWYSCEYNGVSRRMNVAALRTRKMYTVNKDRSARGVAFTMGNERNGDAFFFFFFSYFENTTISVVQSREIEHGGCVNRKVFFWKFYSIRSREQEPRQPIYVAL